VVVVLLVVVVVTVEEVLLVVVVVIGPVEDVVVVVGVEVVVVELPVLLVDGTHSSRRWISSGWAGPNWLLVNVWTVPSAEFLVDPNRIRLGRVGGRGLLPGARESG
jgi:hypothetical protein